MYLLCACTTCIYYDGASVVASSDVAVCAVVPASAAAVSVAVVSAAGVRVSCVAFFASLHFGTGSSELGSM